MWISLFAASLLAAAADADTPELERGFAGAVRGCEEWILNPASWTEGPGPFISAVGLGNSMGRVDKVDEALLPPAQLRRGNYYWRINSTATAGYMLVVSDQLPMCHITGGGGGDLQLAVETVLASTDFTRRWERLGDGSKGQVSSTVFRHRQNPSLSIVISLAKPSQTNAIQVVATATYDLDQ